MATSMLIALLFCGSFFLAALLIGVVKWRSMVTSPNHLAHPYIDIAHRAALLYSFASLVIVKFLEFSPYPEWLNIVAAASPLAFLVLSLSTYLKLGFTRKTDNQFAEPDRARHIGMILLIIAQIGGFGLLFAGFIYTAATGSLG